MIWRRKLLTLCSPSGAVAVGGFFGGVELMGRF
jgi:hypothetical protein